MFSHIVVANDGSEGGFKALAMACDLAKRDGAVLEMISVEVLPNFPASIDETRSQLAGPAGISCQSLQATTQVKQPTHRV